MPEIAIGNPDGTVTMRAWSACELGAWLADNVKPVGGAVSLDTEASGLHVDGMWASDAAKCSPEARVSIVSLAWHEWAKDICPPCYGATVGVPVGGDHEDGCMGDGSYERLERRSVAIPFDQGMIGGKQGRYIKRVTKRTPVLGWQIIPHTAECVFVHRPMEDRHIPPQTCVCAPWNFGVQGWRDLCEFLVSRVDFFNAKYDMWIMLAGLRNGAHAACDPRCVGWQHAKGCLNAGVDLSGQLGRDVMLWESIVDPVQKASLDNVAHKFFGERKDNGIEEGLKANGVGLGKRYDLVAWDIAGKYAAKDADLTCRAVMREDSMRDMGEIDFKDFPIIEREHEKCLTLFRMEQRGVGFDADLCAEQAVKMHAEVATLVGQLPFTANSIAAGKYFFGSPESGGLGIMPIKLTDGGAPSCDAEVVARLTHEQGTAGEVAKLWAHISNMQSVCSKWYDAWPNRAGRDGRLRTNYWQCSVESDRADGYSGGAISGRLSADRVQLQGVPQAWRIPPDVVGIKKLFRARAGHEVWEIDASNAEVRVAAWLSQCHALAAVINSGVNVHDANTKNIFGIDETDPRWTQIRTSMKRGIFGTIYASGVRTLKQQIDADLKADIPERDIRRFQDELNAAYPELKRTAKACERKVDTNIGGPGYVRLVSGRRRVFGWGEKTYKAFNACVQGGVSEMMSVLMLEVDRTYPGILINQVHDSLWLEIPSIVAESIVKDVQAMGKDIFERAFSTNALHITFEFDAKRLV